MADLPTGPSFIPKQNPVKLARRGNTRQVYVFTVISYFLIIAALIAVAGVFLFDRYTKQVLTDEIENLNTAISAFDPLEMDRVIELDERLRSGEERLNNTISVGAVLKILEDATIDTVQFSELSLRRDENNNIVATANITTDSFDSVLFQRSMYEAAKDVATVTLENVAIEFGGAGDGEEVMTGEPTVQFTAVFSVNKEVALYVPPVGTSTPARVAPAPAATTTTSATTSATSQ